MQSSDANSLGKPFCSFTSNYFSRFASMDYLKYLDSKQVLITFTNHFIDSIIVLDPSLQYPSITLILMPYANMFISNAQFWILDNPNLVATSFFWMEKQIMCTNWIHEMKKQNSFHSKPLCKALLIITKWMIKTIFEDLLMHNFLVSFNIITSLKLGTLHCLGAFDPSTELDLLVITSCIIYSQSLSSNVV